jgi:hypothetical protein
LATPISAAAKSSPVWKRFSACFLSARQRDVGAQLVERRRLGLGDLVGDADQRLAVERQVPGQQLVEHDAGGEEVRARIDLLAQHLLRRHVVGRAQHAAGLGGLRGLALVDPADAEVGDLDRGRVADHHDVGGLDVAVDDALLVRVVERAHELDADLDDRLGRQQLLRVEHVFERAALDQFHRDVRMAALVADVEHRHDVRVRQHAGALGLAQEPDVVFRIAAQLRLQHLDRELPVDVGIVGAEDLGHGAFAESGTNLVATYPFHQACPLC